jgi:hypothetical protein
MYVFLFAFFLVSYQFLACTGSKGPRRCKLDMRCMASKQYGCIFCSHGTLDKGVDGFTVGTQERADWLHQAQQRTQWRPAWPSPIQGYKTSRD